MVMKNNQEDLNQCQKMMNYTGLQPSYLNSNKYQSNTYKNRGVIQTTRNIITSSNSNNKIYLGNSALNIPKIPGTFQILEVNIQTLNHTSQKVEMTIQNMVHIVQIEGILI